MSTSSSTFSVPGKRRGIRSILLIVGISILVFGAIERSDAAPPATENAQNPAPQKEKPAPRKGRVRVVGHALIDEDGPFLGFGVSYFTALWRHKHDRQRLESDLAFLSAQGFNYYRMLSMVGWFSAWNGQEIAPVTFNSHDGKRVDAWHDYSQQLAGLIDLAYDRYGMRTQITIFADAQLMPDKPARVAHMNQILTEIVPGREHKIILLEVANEAWQNGFPGKKGTADLREFAKYLGSRTEIPVAITSNHEGSIGDVYEKSTADIATWHFSRDKQRDDGWKPVYDCWLYSDRTGIPPASSNEPIGPGSSVASETDLIHLIAAPAFAYVARLPMFVFHCEAGVFGKSKFEETPAINRFGPLLRILPGDVSNWKRNDGKKSTAVFTAYAAGQPNLYWPDVQSSNDGCVANIGSQSGDRFICVPIGIRPGGLPLEARQDVRFFVCDPTTGEVLLDATKRTGEKFTLPPGPGALLIVGWIIPANGTPADSMRTVEQWTHQTSTKVD